MTKAKPEDGFGPRERQRVTSAIRQVWYQSKARKVAIARCTDSEGFTWCEQCDNRVPKIQVDHLVPVGAIDSDGAIVRMFVSSKGLRVLCKKCHAPKTKAEKKKRVRKDTVQRNTWERI